MDKLLNKFKSSEENIKCKGIIYRAQVNAYINKRGEYIYQERMSLLKRKSGTGCPDCYYFAEMLYEDVNSNILPIISNIVHNQLYRLTIVNIYKDFETGNVDNYDLEFCMIKEN